MTPNRLITLAIHTYDKAIPVKALLEREGVYVELNNVNLAAPVVSPGVRLRIKESDLPLALRIVENMDIFTNHEGDLTGNNGTILIPTDFSDNSLNAAKSAMKLAARLKWEIEFLYAFISPAKRDTVQLSDAYDYELADIAATRELKTDSHTRMKRFTDKIKDAIKSGEVPAVKFSSEIKEGIPEEVILEYSRDKKPPLIVMGTREANKKETDLIGSVTAEVLDGCRVPAFTIPENVSPELFSSLRRVAFLCNFDQDDMIALDALYRMFPDFPLEVTLVDIPTKRLRSSQSDKDKKNLLEYCRSHYNGYLFDMLTIDPKILTSDMKAKGIPFQMLTIPNKRKNAIARIFNPSFAHRILFSNDIPMLVIPV